MATLRRLGDSDLSYVPAPDEFAALAAATLGNAGTSTDGHDAEMQALAVTLAADNSTPGLLDGDLANAAFSPGEFEGREHLGLGIDYTAFVQSGDSVLGGYSAATGTGVAAAPGTQPAPSPSPAPAPLPPPEPPDPNDGGGRGDPCNTWDNGSPLCVR